MADDVYRCPLLDREISEGNCYDVNMVAYGYIKPSAIEDNLPNGASEICEKCPHTQLTE